MNASNVRRHLMADPRHLDAETAAFLRGDAKLTALRTALLASNDAISSALGEAAPPKGLADRIILQARHRRSARWTFALAASVLLAATLAWVMVPGVQGTAEPIAVAMIDHVIESPEELTDNPGVSGAEARASLQRIGVNFRDAGYRIRHIGECVVAGRTGRHLVIDTPEGLATLLVLPVKPGEMSRRRTLNKGNFLAVVMPQTNVAVAAVGRTGVSSQHLETLARQMFTLET